jgi:hypothetical protein
MFFRAESVEAVYRYASALLEVSSPAWIWDYILNVALLCVPLFVFQIWQQRADGLIPFPVSRWSRGCAQGILVTVILVMAQREEIKPFIYFQF